MSLQPVLIYQIAVDCLRGIFAGEKLPGDTAADGIKPAYYRSSEKLGRHSADDLQEGPKKKRARCGRRCTGLLILTDNWEEECCQSDEGALGGGVRCLRDY